MTNTEKLAWLNDINTHLAAGGRLEYDKDAWRISAVAPSWYSDPAEWRKVPLPRKATIRVAYRWLEDGLRTYTMHTDDLVHAYIDAGWQVTEIEVMFAASDVLLTQLVQSHIDASNKVLRPGETKEAMQMARKLLERAEII